MWSEYSTIRFEKDRSTSTSVIRGCKPASVSTRIAPLADQRLSLVACSMAHGHGVHPTGPPKECIRGKRGRSPSGSPCVYFSQVQACSLRERPNGGETLLACEHGPRTSCDSPCIIGPVTKHPCGAAPKLALTPHVTEADRTLAMIAHGNPLWRSPLNTSASPLTYDEYTHTNQPSPTVRGTCPVRLRNHSQFV